MSDGKGPAPSEVPPTSSTMDRSPADRPEPPTPPEPPIPPETSMPPETPEPQFRNVDTDNFDEAVNKVDSIRIFNDQNVDSGINTEKSDSGSSDMQMFSAETLTAEGASASTSGVPPKEETDSNCRVFKLPRPSRNYRSRRANPDKDSDDDMSIDSDDFSGEGTMHSNNTSVESSDDDEDEDDNDNIDDDDNGSDSTSLDDENLVLWSDICGDNDQSNDEREIPPVLLKRKPNYQWNPVKELINRELGNLSKPGRTGKTDVMFEQRFYGSLRTVERLELMYKLNKHKGCVNSINFHPEGHLLASGSDDLNIIIWDWTTNVFRKVVKTDHKSNIFQSRFLHLNATSQIDIVSCGRDGQVLLTQVLTGGGPPIKRRLAEHGRSAHKLYTSSSEPHVIVSAGEDARVILSDVRQEKPNKLLIVQDNDMRVPLYSVACHPLDTHEMCVAGRGRKVMVYDRRKISLHAKPVKSYCPDFFRTSNLNPQRKKRTNILAYVTCAVYNHNGSEILASYNDDDIYLFDTEADYESSNSAHGFSNFYCGHRNSETFKGVSFFGPHSEFVVSGSDCGNIFIWDKKTESIVQWMMGDEGGVVNCIESHPRFPVLATSGLDKDIKIWVPSNENNPKLEGLKDTVIKNINERSDRPLFNFLPRVFDIFQAEESDSNSEGEEILEPGCAAF